MLYIFNVAVMFRLYFALLKVAISTSGQVVDLILRLN